jgi:hypothetical protein
MGPIAIGFGVVLTLLGLWGYLATDKVSITALIPSFFGLALVLLGRLASNDKLRMHVMHLAALLGLLGFGIPLFMVARGYFTNPNFAFGIAQTEQILMALLCGVFLALCVKSFIDARRNRSEAPK